MSSEPPPKPTLLLGESQSDAPAPDASDTPRRPALIVMSGQKVGTRIRVRGNTAVGRDLKSELTLPDQGVSYRHALIEDRGASFVLVDLGSTNGSFVNGERAKERPLQHGDKLRFGQTVVRFEIQDATDEAFAEEVAQLLNVDDLTGLYLRRRFDNELDVLLQHAQAQRRTLALLVMDLDGVKAINDQHGHLFGAYTIGEAGKFIGARLTVPAIACRFGGDEYIVALPDHDLQRGLIVAEALRAGIAEHPFVYEGTPLRPGISIGVAEFPTHGSSVETLFRAADAALYDAKRAGKNRVALARDPSSNS